MASAILQLWGANQTDPIAPTGKRIGAFEFTLTQFHSGLSAGVWQLVVRWGSFQVQLLPTRGMSIESVTVGDVRFGWQSPIPGPVHPAWVPLAAPDGLGWLNGFTELLARCGLNSNGAPQFSAGGRLEYPLHGAIGNLPAQSLAIELIDEETLDVVADVHEARFHFHHWRLRTRYRMCAGQNQIVVSDIVTNLSGQRRDFQLLYHFNLGLPLLEPGGRIHVGAEGVVPRNAIAEPDRAAWDAIPAARPGEPEHVFFMQPKMNESGQALAVLRNAATSLAAGIEFDARALPCFTLWKDCGDPRDGFVVGLEPGTNFPNSRDQEARQGRTRWLDPGESATFNCTLHFASQPGLAVRLVERARQV